ncbi:hypothetical protein PLESTM_000083800 [Pleodorina starrii]|nr:hypothetical protein PLESTM_000083800 [Pleodorina starrii]
MSSDKSDRFRLGVTHKAEKVWQYNNNKDLFTGWRKNYVLDNYDAEVDHIVECQVGQNIWDRVFDGRRTTRGRLAPVRDIWNDLDNLNNTPMHINRKKGDGFERWLAGHEHDLRSALRYYDVASNHCIKIVTTFEDTANVLCDSLDELAVEKSLDLYAEFACVLADWRDRA